jgi:hypothetical protein
VKNKWLVIILSGLILGTNPFWSAAQDDEEEEGDGITLDFVVNAMPAALLLQRDSDNFAVEGADGRVSMSTVYLMPNVMAGVGSQVDNFYLDLTAGCGILVNDSFRSFLLQAAVGAQYIATESVSFGPRVGVIHFANPEWLESDDLDFDSSTGLLLGLQMSMGDKVSYMFSVDWITSDFDLDADPGVLADDTSLELDAIAIQFGVRGEF